uniref:Subtilisin n=1 Tax=Alexandrium monilatum TaxID=311494 RepID=A0A7S4RS87_9DINO
MPYQNLFGRMSYVRILLLSLAVPSQGLQDAATPYRIVSLLVAQRLPDQLASFSPYFSQHVPVIRPVCQDCLGVHVVATDKVQRSKVERVATVLAQYLDNNEDGWADNARVAAQMDRRGAVMVMCARPEELDEMNFTCDGFMCQDDYGNETGPPLPLDTGSSGNSTHPGGLPVQGRVLFDSTVGLTDAHLRCVHNRSAICDAPLEEAFHLLTDVGFAHAYPDLLGTQPGSALSLAMMGTIGSCGYNTEETPMGKYARFHFPNCTGTYHYADETCSFSCLATEYFHHVIASYNGEYAWGRADLPVHNRELCNGTGSRALEWENCAAGPDALHASRKALRSGSPDGVALLVDSGFKVPLVMPSGRYSPPLFATSAHLRGSGTLQPRPLRLQDVRLEFGRARS